MSFNTNTQAPAEQVTAETSAAVQTLTAAALNETQPLEGAVWTDLTIRFRKTKDKDGKEVAARDPIDLVVPTLDKDGIIAMLSSVKEDGTLSNEATLVIDACAEIVLSRSREVVSDLLADNKEVSLATFPLDAVSWAAIANLPTAERKGRGIPKEVWDAFKEGYVSYFLAQGFETTKVEAAVGLCLARLQPIKANKPMLSKLRGYVESWFANTGADADAGMTEVFKFLNGKFEEFLNADEAKDLEKI